MSGTHVNRTLQAEAGADCGGGRPVLAGTDLRQDPPTQGEPQKSALLPQGSRQVALSDREFLCQVKEYRGMAIRYDKTASRDAAHGNPVATFLAEGQSHGSTGPGAHGASASPSTFPSARRL